MINPFALSGLLLFITSSILCVFSVFHAQKRIMVIWSIFNLSVAIWGFSAFKFASTMVPSEVFFWLRFGHLGVIVLPLVFIHFILEFLGEKKKILFPIYCIGFLFFLLNLTDWFGWTRLFIVQIRYVFNSFYVDSPPGIMYYFFVFYFWLLTVLTFYYCIRGLKTATGILKVQLKYFLLAMVILWCGGSAFLMVFKIDIYPWPHLLSFIYPLIITYAIVKYHLLDVRVVISRTMIFVFVYMPILAFPFLLTWFQEDFLKSLYGDKYWILPTCLEGIVAVLGLFIYKFIQNTTERRLLRKAYEHEQAIRDLSNDLVRIEEIDSLVKKLVERCMDAAKIKYVGFYLKSNQGFELRSTEGEVTICVDCQLKQDNPFVCLLEKHQDILLYEEVRARDTKAASILKGLNGAVVVPVMRKDQLMGILILGEKESENIYTPIELMAFKVLANQVGLAIVNTQFLAEIRKMETQLNEARRMKEFGYLLNSLGHEIRNEISSVQMGVFMMTSDEELFTHTNPDKSTEQHQYLKDMMSHLVNMQKIMDELTSFMVREDPGVRTKVDVLQIVDRVLVVLKLRNEKLKDMDIQVTGNVVALANPVQLQTVLYNMLNNSYDAIMRIINLNKNSDGLYHGKIGIEMVAKEDRAHIYIRDNGNGITEEDQKQLYTLLFTTKGNIQKKELREEERMGIGMHKIREIMRAHGGEIEVLRSARNEGCEFLLTLPLYSLQKYNS